MKIKLKVPVREMASTKKLLTENLTTMEGVIALLFNTRTVDLILEPNTSINIVSNQIMNLLPHDSKVKVPFFN